MLQKGRKMSNKSASINIESKGTKTRGLGLVNRGNYFKIWGFMRYDLHLEKTELLVYAIIFSYYYQSCDTFVGTREYLAEWTGSSRSSIDEALRSLIKKGYIEKGKQRIGGAERCYYTVNIRALPKCSMFEIEHRRIEIESRMNKTSAGA